MTPATPTEVVLKSLASAGNIVSQMRIEHIAQNAANHILLNSGIEETVIPRLCVLLQHALNGLIFMGDSRHQYL